MGGITVDVNYMSDKSYVTLTPLGLVFLAELGYYVDVSLETIAHKSKVNILGKMLVCIQVTWMAVQCIARKAAEYPLTLLEVHTMVHVACALILYILWFPVGHVSHTTFMMALTV
jgi:hypothetical protein